MTLSSGTYLVFLAICLILHNLLPDRFRNFWLLLASVGFFLCSMPLQTVVMLLFCLIVFFLGSAIHAAAGRMRTALLIAGILLGAGFLLFYKYLSFFASLLGLRAQDWMLSLVAPLGVSYVTFQCISYLAEIHKKQLDPEKNPIDFLVYTLFFAKLTAGPIESPNVFLSQLKQPRICTIPDAKFAFLRIAMGFIKKITVADVIAPCVNAIYATSSPSGWASFLAITLYAVQILFDFSGYTDIARGSAALFGISLTENFNAPYHAHSIRDFWRRWHISLSTWLRCYIFFPLGGSRVALWKRCLNILIVFLVSGIWHGASLTFVVWGLLHGLFQVIETLLDPWKKRLRSKFHISERNRLLPFLDWLRTIVLVSVSWVFFRAPDLDTAISLLSGLLGNWGNLSSAMQMCGLNWTALLLLSAGVFCVSRLSRILLREKEPSFTETLSVCVVAAWAVLLVYLVNTASGSVSSFIYFDF